MQCSIPWNILRAFPSAPRLLKQIRGVLRNLASTGGLGRDRRGYLRNWLACSKSTICGLEDAVRPGTSPEQAPQDHRSALYQALDATINRGGHWSQPLQALAELETLMASAAAIPAYQDQSPGGQGPDRTPSNAMCNLDPRSMELLAAPGMQQLRDFTKDKVADCLNKAAANDERYATQSGGHWTDETIRKPWRTWRDHDPPLLKTSGHGRGARTNWTLPCRTLVGNVEGGCRGGQPTLRLPSSLAMSASSSSVGVTGWPRS